MTKWRSGNTIINKYYDDYSILSLDTEISDEKRTGMPLKKPSSMVKRVECSAIKELLMGLKFWI